MYFFLSSGLKVLQSADVYREFSPPACLEARRSFLEDLISPAGYLIGMESFDIDLDVGSSDIDAGRCARQEAGFRVELEPPGPFNQ